MFLNGCFDSCKKKPFHSFQEDSTISDLKAFVVTWNIAMCPTTTTTTTTTTTMDPLELQQLLEEGGNLTELGGRNRTEVVEEGFFQESWSWLTTVFSAADRRKLAEHWAFLVLGHAFVRANIH